MAYDVAARLAAAVAGAAVRRTPSVSIFIVPNIRPSLQFRPAFPSPAFGRTRLFSTRAAPPKASPSAAASARSGGLVGWYLAAINARPVITKSLTAGLIFTTADASSQMITLSPNDLFDVTRTMRMATYGMLISGPSLHLWFNFVSRVLPKRDLLTTFKKMAMGQLIYGPIITVVFFSLNAVLQGESMSEIIARLKRDLIPTFISGLMYWPMCDFITFKFIPVHLQPLVSNSFSFLWSIYLTYMASLKKARVEAVDVVAVE